MTAQFIIREGTNRFGNGKIAYTLLSEATPDYLKNFFHNASERWKHLKQTLEHHQQEHSVDRNTSSIVVSIYLLSQDAQKTKGNIML